MARAGIANASIQMDLMNEALRHVEILIDQLQDFVTPGDLSATGGDVLFNSKLLRAKIYLELKREGEAVAQLESLVEEVPGYFMSRFLLATEYSKRGQSARVMDVIEPIQARFPDDVSLNYLLATAESDQGKLAQSSELMQKHLGGKGQLEAVKQMELAGRTTELHPQFYREAARAYLRFQWDAAQPWSERALAIEPNSLDVLPGFAEFYDK